jgi:hypothetical protein
MLSLKKNAGQGCQIHIYFHTKNAILGYILEGLGMETFGVCRVNLVLLLLPFGYIFIHLVFSTKKNLATLMPGTPQRRV